MNRQRTILRFLSCTASTACLASGFIITGQWGFAAAAFLLFLGWLSDFKRPSDWLPPTALVAAVGLSVAGVVSLAPAALMLMAATFALAAWDLAIMDHALASNPPSASIGGLVRRRYQNLALVVGVGLLVTITGQVIRFQIPFAGMVVLVISVLYSLVRLWRSFSE